VRAADTIMVGARMDTDVIGGLESGLMTALVPTEVTSELTLHDFHSDRTT
jgi:NagD protein